MSEPEIDSGVRDLLRERVSTYEVLDTLLLLWRRQVAVELEVVAQGVAHGQRIVREALSQLVASGLVVEDPAGWFRYRPRAAADRVAVERLARLFEENPVRVVQWMSRNAVDRLHHSAANAFAEAVLTGKKNRD